MQIIVRKRFVASYEVHNSIFSFALVPFCDILGRGFLGDEIPWFHFVAIDYTILAGRSIAYNGIAPFLKTLNKKLLTH